MIHPYCIGEEPTTYDIVDGHALAGQGTFEVQQQQNTAVGSKGGYLTKRGNIVKVSDTFPMLFITQPFSPSSPFRKSFFSFKHSQNYPLQLCSTINKEPVFFCRRPTNPTLPTKFTIISNFQGIVFGTFRTFRCLNDS